MSGSSRAGSVFIHDEQFRHNAYPPTSPFRTDRGELTRRILASMGLLSSSQIVPPRAATREELERFHEPAYLDVLVDAAKGKMGVEGLHMGLGTGDCPVFVGMYEYGAMAAGATLTAAEQILSGRAHVAFNPSGGFHHAMRNRAAGFCYINDVVLGCMALTDAGRRVLFLDLDVHHGDGVQDAFYDRADVCTISMHETGRRLFPGTGFPHEQGAGDGAGFSVNLPLPPGTYDRPYLKAFRAVVLPVIQAYGPDVIVLELGVDGLAGDPLAELELTNNVYADMIADLLRFGVPILATGGGGYNPDNAARAWALAWTVLSGQELGRDAAVGLGGVMLASTDWQAGLRDPQRVPPVHHRRQVDRAVDEMIAAVSERVFPRFGIERKDSGDA